MKEWWEKIKKNCWPPRKDQLLILVLLGLLLAVIAVPVNKEQNVHGQETGEGEEKERQTEDYESCMEEKLEEILSRVEGVGLVQVMLTFEGTGEKKVEKDESISSDASQEETVYEEYSGSERVPYVTAESNPRVEGALIIAQGGGNSRVKQEILEAVQALFGIEAHKIKIMKMEGTK